MKGVGMTDICAKRLKYRRKRKSHFTSARLGLLYISCVSVPSVLCSSWRETWTDHQMKLTSSSKVIRYSQTSKTRAPAVNTI